MSLLITFTISLQSQSIYEKFNTFKLNGFIIKHNHSYHIITVHHFIPINNITINSERYNIKINSCWSEILILDCDHTKFNKYKIISDFKNDIPDKGVQLNLKFDKENIKLNMNDLTLLPIDNIKGPQTIYIVCDIPPSEKSRSWTGLSGSPVFYKKKLIGIFSKYYTREDKALIIPIYFVFKNLIKRDNDKIFTCSTPSSEYFLHPIIKQKIPLETFCLIEGDDDLILEINDNKYSLNTARLLFSFEQNIIFNEVDKNYILNFRLLTLMNKLGTNVMPLISKRISEFY